jgi:hypothetical protein
MSETNPGAQSEIPFATDDELARQLRALAAELLELGGRLAAEIGRLAELLDPSQPT